MDNVEGAEGGAGQKGEDQANGERSDAGIVLKTFTDDRDVLIVANQLIKQFSQGALQHAASRHLELWNAGAYTGSMVWNRIYNAILDAQHPELIETSDETDQH